MNLLFRVRLEFLIDSPKELEATKIIIQENANLMYHGLEKEIKPDSILETSLEVKELK